jgi:hypothetical protein
MSVDESEVNSLSFDIPLDPWHRRSLDDPRAQLAAFDTSLNNAGRLNVELGVFKCLHLIGVGVANSENSITYSPTTTMKLEVQRSASGRSDGKGHAMETRKDRTDRHQTALNGRQPRTCSDY